jgi:hypothetical protein
MMHSVRKLRHPIAVFIVTVFAVIAIGVGIVAATGNAALVSTNIAPSVLATIAGEQAFAYSVVPAGTVPRVSLSEAIASGAWDPAKVVAAQLLEIRAPITDGKTTLVWAIQEPPEGGAIAPLGIAGGKIVAVKPPEYNFQVDFVNADSGKVVFSTDGHAPTGAPLG